MALARKLKQDDFDKLDSAVKPLYLKVGDSYVLDLDGEDEGTTAAKSETAAEKSKRLALESELAALRGDKAKSDELAMKAAGDIAGLETAWGAKLTTAVEVEKANTAKAVGMLESQMLDSVSGNMASKLSSKAGKLLQPLIRARLGVDMSGDSPAIVVKGADGKPSALTQENLHDEFFNNADYAAIIDGSKSTGGQQQQQQQQQPKMPQGQGDKPVNYGTISPGDLVAIIDANKQ